MSDGYGAEVPWPTGPPPMPPPGWYEDPERSWTWRWWDGARWTELRSPMWVPPARDPQSFSAWFDRSVACVKAVVKRLGLLLLVIWLAVMAPVGVFVISIWRSGRAEELRRLLEFETDRFGSGSSATLELTDAEVDRVWELLGQLFWVALPWMIALGVLLMVVSLWSTAAIARAARIHVDDVKDGAKDDAEHVVETRAATLAASSRRIPATLGSSVVVGCIGIAPFLAAALIVLPFVLVDSGPAAIVLTAVFAVLAASVLSFWLWGRLALAVVIAAIGGHGLGIRRSWGLADGHFWGTIGRLIVAGLIAGVVTTPASILNSFGFALGVTTFLIVWFVLQAVASAAGAIVNVSAQVVLVDQLSDE